MPQSLLEALPSNIKFWFAQAVAGLITADGIVTESELEFLKEAISFLEDIKDVNNVVAKVKNKEKVTLQKLETNHKIASMILIHIATIAITDGKLDDKEIDFFKYVGHKLGFESQFSEEVLTWAKDYISVTKRKKVLLKKAEKCHIY